MLRFMMGVFLLLFSLPCAACSGAPVAEEDPDETRRTLLKDPSNVWTLFQKHLREGEFHKAHQLIHPACARDILPYEVFFIIFASFDTPRRMILTTEAHRVEAGATTGKLLLCGREFGVCREVKLAKYRTIWTLEFSRDDVDYFKGRPMAWARHQVKRADGWHFAYPPDWSYAPLRRECCCER